jgi:hypothetical protein
MEEEHYKLLNERRLDAQLEYFKQAHDTQKHMGTLSAGAIVIIGTFLKDIFPKTPAGVLDVSLPTKLLIAAAFLCFGICLAASVYLLRIYPLRYRETGWMEHIDNPNMPAPPVAQEIRPIGLYAFPIGLAFFAIAVLVTLL